MRQSIRILPPYPPPPKPPPPPPLPPPPYPPPEPPEKVVPPKVPTVPPPPEVGRYQISPSRRTYPISSKNARPSPGPRRSSHNLDIVYIGSSGGSPLNFAIITARCCSHLAA